MSDELVEFGAELRRRRMAAGLSLEDLSGKVHYSKGYLSRVETGKKAPHPDLARLCDVALEANGALINRVPRQRSRRQSSSPPGASTAGETHVLAPAVSAAGASLCEDPVALEAMETMFNDHRKAGTTVGAGLIESAVTQQAHILMGASFANGHYRPRLLTLAARYAEYAGWMLQECGADAAALRWTDHAVAMAAANNDHVMEPYALVRRALFALYHNQAQDVIELATRARLMAATPDWLRRLAFQREAQGHAIDGNYDATLRALDLAAALPQRDETEETPSKLGPTTVADLHAMTIGWCLTDLGRAHTAAEILDREVARIPATARRSRARYGMRRALAHVLSGEIDHACEVAGMVVPDAMAMRSATVAVDVGRLSATLGRYRLHPPVRILLPRLADVMSATAAVAQARR